MSAVQQGTLLEVLKKKMRAMKDELETAKEQAEDAQSRVMDEIRRREEVSGKLALNRAWCSASLEMFLSALVRRDESSPRAFADTSRVRNFIYPKPYKGQVFSPHYANDRVAVLSSGLCPFCDHRSCRSFYTSCE